MPLRAENNEVYAPSRGTRVLTRWLERDSLPSYLNLNLIQYEDTIRQRMRDNRWEDAKEMLDAADLQWGKTTAFYFLNGRYYYEKDSVDLARRYWLSACREDPSEPEALEWLMKLEEQEGNYATAIVHANDLLAFSPYSIRLWRKKIQLYRLSGNEAEANRLLERLAEIYPESEQVQQDVAYQRETMMLAARKRGDEQAVQQNLAELIKTDTIPNAEHYIDLVNSLIKEGKLQEAEEVCAKGVNSTQGNRNLIRKRVSLLEDRKRYDEAEAYLKDCIRLYKADDLQPLLLRLQGDAAEHAAEDEAYTRYARLYGKQRSPEAREWLIRTAMQRGYWDDAQYYIAEARREEGDSDQLLAKAYTVEQRMGNQRAASRLLEQRFALNNHDGEVRELIAEKRLHEATDLMQEEHYGEAIPLLEQADTLTTDEEMLAVIARRLSTCHSLLPDTTKQINPLDTLDWMQQSVYYERAHQTDSAYACLMRYQPSLNEYHYVTRHRYALQSRLLKNTISLEYQYARRSSADQWSHNAYINYAHNFGKDVLEVSAAYAGRESSSWTEEDVNGNDSTVYSTGGSGVQLGLGYAHYFQWGDIHAQASWASRFLPFASVKLSVSENLPAEWVLTERLSWRYINDETRYHLFSAGCSASWTYGQFMLTPTIDAFLLRKHVYFNGGLKFQFFPLDGDRSYVFTNIGAGNAPEVSLLDNNLPVRFDHLNTNVSAGGMYMINGHFGLSGSVSWYLIGGKATSIRNYIYLNVSMNIRF